MESQRIKGARTAEARVMSRLGLLDTWRHIYDDVDDEVAVGATRGHRRIDRILLSSSYGALSPTLFSLLTTLLVDDLQKKCPQAVPYLYADDTPIWIPGGRRQALARLKRVTEVLYKYSLVSGYKLNMHKCK